MAALALVQPKKPAGGAFGAWLAVNREALALERPGQPVTAVTKLASERWKEVPEGVRVKYQTKYEKNKNQFNADMAEFLAAGGVKQPGARAKAKARAAAKAEGAAKTTAPPAPAASFVVSIAGYSRKTFDQEDFQSKVPIGGKIFDLMDENGRPKRSFSVKFKRQDDFNKALAMDGTQFYGRILTIQPEETPMPAMDAAPEPSAAAKPRASAKRKREPEPVEQKSLSAFVQASLGKLATRGKLDMKTKMDAGGPMVDSALLQKEFSDRLCKRNGIPPKERAQYSEALGAEVWTVWKRLMDDDDNYA